MRAVFLDRDGVINELVYFPELGLMDSPLNPRQFKLMPDAAKAIGVLNRLGLKVIVVSNQPVVAKGKTTMELFERIRQKMKRELTKGGAHVDAEYYCFHHPEAKISKYRVRCSCRKPKPGLIVKAAEDHNIDLARSYLVGDNLSDIEAGKAAGCTTFLIGFMKDYLSRAIDETGIRPDFVVPNLLEAVKIIKKDVQGNLK